ncbi:MAG: hypothetical protein ABI364_02040, partial [Caldimonas sp.]
ARQLRLDETKRRERTAERRSELAAKAAEDAQRERARAAKDASAPASSARRKGVPHALEPRHDGAAERAPKPGALRDQRGTGRSGAKGKRGSNESAAERGAREERSEGAFAERQREAAVHRQEVLSRAAKRMKEGSPAEPLPIPASVPAR